MACGSNSFSWRLVTTAVFSPHYQLLIIVMTIDLSIVNNASQTGRRVTVFHWPANVWYPCMAWKLFINRPKTSRPWLYIEFPRSEFHRQMANKRKERYFWNIIFSIIGWYKAEKSKFFVKIWNISHYQQAFGMMQWFIFRYLA
jgi:hypothetical protein